VTATWKSITPSDLWLEVQALKNGSVVATGTHDPILSQYYQTGKFDNSASKEFDAIRLSLKGASFAGLSSSTFYWDNAPSWGPLATNEVFDAPVITHVGDESATALFHSTGDVSLASPDLKLHFARNLPSPNNQWPENSRWRIQMTADFNAVDAQAANSHLSHTPPCLDIAKDNTSFYGGNFTHFVPTLVGTRASLDTVYTKPLPSNTIWMTLSVTVTPNTLVHYPREVDIQLIVSPAPDANRRIVIQEFLIWNICSI
jgi:hypothetical protein